MTADDHQDAALADRARTLLGRRHPVVGVGTVVAGQVRCATVGAPADADLEIGSVSKGVTGLLYADALARGELTPTSTLGDHLPLAGAPAAAVPLADLATHRSGLPRLAPSSHVLRATVDLWRRGTNPYGETLAELLDQAREVTLGRPGRSSYSNLGFELLGHAVAAAAGRVYGDLLRERVTEPLGLDVMYAPATAGDLRPQAVVGRGRGGRRKEPWTGEALAPAGGIRATTRAMADLTAALLDGSAPGLTALDPVRPLGRGARIGAGWVTVEFTGRPVTWHNGGTGGFGSWLGLDRATGTGVVVLSATAASVDRHGFALLAELSGNAPRARR